MTTYFICLVTESNKIRTESFVGNSLKDVLEQLFKKWAIYTETNDYKSNIVVKETKTGLKITNNDFKEPRVIEETFEELRGFMENYMPLKNGMEGWFRSPNVQGLVEIRDSFLS